MINGDQGPVLLVEICFDRLIAGLGALTVRVLLAVLPVTVVPEMIVETLPLVLV